MVGMPDMKVVGICRSLGEGSTYGMLMKLPERDTEAGGEMSLILLGEKDIKGAR